MNTWVPSSPDELIRTAAELDRFWADAESRGYSKPTLAEELEFIEDYYSEPERGA